MHNIKNIRYLYHNCYIISTLKASLTKLWISFVEFKANSGRTDEKSDILSLCLILNETDKVKNNIQRVHAASSRRSQSHVTLFNKHLD